MCSKGWGFSSAHVGVFTNRQSGLGGHEYFQTLQKV
jgi:hypothetical protein